MNSRHAHSRANELNIKAIAYKVLANEATDPIESVIYQSRVVKIVTTRDWWRRQA